MADTRLPLRPCRPKSGQARSVLAVLVATCSLGSTALGQVRSGGGDGLAFEAASVVASKSASAPRGTRLHPGGRLTLTNVTLLELVRFAYQPSAFGRIEVSGGPTWVDSDRFDLAARAPGEHVFDSDGFPRQIRVMLRRLLQEQFQLRVRIQSKVLPTYALVVASGGEAIGPQLHRSHVDCGAITAAIIDGQPPPMGERGPLCAHARYPRRLVASGITMPDLAAVLSPLLDRIVVDRTGLPGNFDLELEAVEVHPSETLGPSTRPSETRQSIWTALPEQLGLRLEAAEAAVEYVVIDQAEKPVPPP